MISIKIGEADIELFLSTKAMLDIKESSGVSIENITEWLTDADAGVEEQLRRMTIVVGHLANGAIHRHNANIALGVASGGKKGLFDVSLFADVIGVSQLPECMNAVMAALSDGTAVSVPENLKFEEEDEVLKEIEEEKNHSAGDAEKTVESYTED